MKSTFAVAAALFGVTLAQGVTDKISPTGAPPAGCTGTFSGQFEISVVPATKKRSLAQQPEKRGACGTNGVLVMTLEDGVTKDGLGRTGYIASNYQFQFDGPPQAGALFTSGFSVCDNNVLALGSSKTFYRCLSGSFSNLYDRTWADQCEAVQIIAIPCGGSTGSATQVAGQVVGTQNAYTTIVTALSDGQPQVVTTAVPVPMCQIGDGQIQVHTTPCAAISSVPSSPLVPVTQISDGQIQVTQPAGSQPAVSTYTPIVSKPPTSNSTVTRPPVTVSQPTATPPPATASRPAQGGSAHLAAGSVGAFAVGLLAAVIAF